MRYVIDNLDELPENLPPGQYCAHLTERSTLGELHLNVVFDKKHEPGDCLIQMNKEEPDNDTANDRTTT